MADGVTDVLPVVQTLAERLADLGWVLHLFAAGSLATGDYVPGVSDIDMVAVTNGPVDQSREMTLSALHRDLDRGAAQGLNLGCLYVDDSRMLHTEARHPTWTHGSLIHRTLSAVIRAELVRYGFAIMGRPPSVVLPEMPTTRSVRQHAKNCADTGTGRRIDPGCGLIP